jgi:hypothetical protein
MAISTEGRLGCWGQIKEAFPFLDGSTIGNSCIYRPEVLMGADQETMEAMLARQRTRLADYLGGRIINWQQSVIRRRRASLGAFVKAASYSSEKRRTAITTWEDLEDKSEQVCREIIVAAEFRSLIDQEEGDFDTGVCEGLALLIGINHSMLGDVEESMRCHLASTILANIRTDFNLLMSEENDEEALRLADTAKQSMHELGVDFSYADALNVYVTQQLDDPCGVSGCAPF